MASDIYTSQIKSNGETAESKYKSTMAQLKTDVDKLKGIVSSTIDTEIDRLIDKKEKSRIMGNYSDEMITKKVKALKPSDYFKITGQRIADIATAKDDAISVMKPSEVKRPGTITEADWNAKNIDEKKEAFYDSLSNSEKEKYVFRSIPDTDKVTAIKQDADYFFDALSEDDKLYLIAQYSAREDEEQGTRQAFDNKLEKSQKRKDRLKASIKEAANAVIKSMDAIIAKNNQLIQKLEAQILQKKQELLDLQQKPIDVSKYFQVKNQNLTPDQLKQLEEDAKKDAMKSAQKAIKELQKDLKDAKDAQKEVVEKLNNYKEKIENMLAEKNIYVGSQSIKENDSNDSNKLPDTASNKFGMTATGNSKLKQRQKAKNMLENMMLGTDVADFREMLNQYSYEDMVAMAYQLRGPFNKNKLRRFYDIALEDMLGKDDTKNNELKITLANVFGTDSITLDNLKNLHKLPPEKIKIIQDALTELNTNYSTKSQEEKEKIDLIMDYVKIGMLRRETEHFKGIRNFFRSRVANQRLKTLTVQLRKHAENVYDEKNAIADRYNSFRRSIHVTEVDKSQIIKNPKTPNRNQRDQHIL